MKARKFIAKIKRRQYLDTKCTIKFTSGFIKWPFYFMLQGDNYYKQLRIKTLFSLKIVYIRTFFTNKVVLNAF